MTRMYRRPYRTTYRGNFVTFKDIGDMLVYVSKTHIPREDVQRRSKDGSWSVY